MVWHMIVAMWSCVNASICFACLRCVCMFHLSLLHTRQEHMSQNITDNKTSKNTRVTRDKHKNMWRRERMRTRVCWVLHTRTRDPRMVMIQAAISHLNNHNSRVRAFSQMYSLSHSVATNWHLNPLNESPNKIPGGPWSKRTPHAIISQCEALDPTPSAFWPGKPRAPTQASDKTKTIFVHVFVRSSMEVSQLVLSFLPCS